MAKKVPTVPTDKLELYEKAIGKHPDIVRKGAANPYTSANGHMFSCFNKAGELAIRLSKEDREKFVQKYKTPPFESYGVIMKEYVLVLDKLLKNQKAFVAYLDQSYKYVTSLKPKPTTRKKK